MTFTLNIFNGGEIGGFTGTVVVNGKRFQVPAKRVWTQESVNTEAYCELASYDTADELRAAAKRFVRKMGGRR